MTINYNGYVEVTTRKRKKILHNSGTQILFKRITDIFSGLSFDSNILPTYIQLRHGEGINLVNSLASRANFSQIDDGLLFTPIQVSKQSQFRNLDGTNRWTTVLTCNLMSENIHATLFTSDKYHLVLMDGYNYPLAVIDLDDGSVGDLVNGYDALIQWNICFDNGGNSNAD